MKVTQTQNRCFPQTVFIAAALVFFACLSACSKSPGPEQASQNPAPKTKTETTVPTVITSEDKVWPLGDALLNEAAMSAETLNTQINDLLKLPTSDQLILTQETWRKAAYSIEKFYPLSRLGVAEAASFESVLNGYYNIAAWPIQPGYLDAYGEHQYSGIIFDVGSLITEADVRNQHGLTDSNDATLGIYAIEFLLFGEKSQRSFLMFKEITTLTPQKMDEGYQAKEELPNNRRRDLIQLQSELLAKDIAKLRTGWSSKHPDGLAAHFQKKSKESQRLLLTQIIQTTLTEQILAIAEQQKLSQTQEADLNLWQSQQLADRVSAQLSGLAQLMKAAAESDLQILVDMTLACVNTSNQIRSLTPLATDGKTSIADWKDTYRCIRDITSKLEPEPPQKPE